MTPNRGEGMQSQFVADARFYRSLTGADRSGSRFLAWTLLSNKGLWLLTFHRIAYFCRQQRNRCSPTWWLARLCRIVGTFFSVTFCRSELSADCEITGVAYLPNGGYFMCGARSIGTGSLVHDHCIFGDAVAEGREGRPKIGRNVWIGPNCIIAGSLTVGDGATVLPGSFVTFSIPPGAVAKGNPAVITLRTFDNSALRRSLTVVQDVASDPP